MVWNPSNADNLAFQWNVNKPEHQIVRRKSEFIKMLSQLSGSFIMILLATIILAATILFIFGKRQILRFTLKSKWDNYRFPWDSFLQFLFSSISDTQTHSMAPRTSRGRLRGDSTSSTNFTLSLSFWPPTTSSSWSLDLVLRLTTIVWGPLTTLKSSKRRFR